MLKAQQMRAEEFNHPAGASTELDSLGQEIRRLWKFGPKDSDEKFESFTPSWPKIGQGDYVLGK